MNWDSVTLTVLAGFGIALLVLTQIRELLAKITEIVHAWHELRSSVREREEEGTAPSSARRAPDHH